MYIKFVLPNDTPSLDGITTCPLHCQYEQNDFTNNVDCVTQNVLEAHFGIGPPTVSGGVAVDPLVDVCLILMDWKIEDFWQEVLIFNCFTSRVEFRSWELEDFGAVLRALDTNRATELSESGKCTGKTSGEQMLHSSAATLLSRLSQRLLMSVSATQDFDVESWDISGAFLKGLTFEQIRELLRARGISAPMRKVALVVPRNVWRHLAACDPSFKLPEDRIDDYVLVCLKPVYGLNDAPLAWQLCLHQHFESTGGIPSLQDENMFFWMRGKGEQGITALATTHVDDVGAGSKKSWLTEQYNLLCAKFGRVTRQELPFHHCGVLYSKTADGFSMTQDDFCKKLKPATIPNKKDDAASSVTQAKVMHLKQANAVIKRAQDEIGHGLGLHYRKLKPPFKLACIHDSSAAGNVRHYAQEGVLVLLMEDRLKAREDEYEKTLMDHETQLLSGKAHLLWGHGAKAKRTSYSTSHAETLAAISGLEASSLITVRLAELLHMSKRPTVTSLLTAQELGLRQIPVDDFTDCKDFYELASGDKSVSQDKGQRLYILAFREARLHGRVRWLVLTPTESMTADGLTKSMVAPPLMELLSTGTVNFYNQGDHKMQLRRLPQLQHVKEGDYFEHGLRVFYDVNETYGMHFGFYDDYCGGFFDKTDLFYLDFLLYQRRRWWLVLDCDDSLRHHRRGMDAVGFATILVEPNATILDYNAYDFFDYANLYEYDGDHLRRPGGSM
ncbi:unnamed protein product [Symbiodinium sp. CCMP2592]|nr:unnamed protein product [Symbiodinium sp. CCMP2592]